MALTISSIVSAALALQNEEGLDKVSTRRLAVVLGVQGPALYRHVRSMQELLGEMYAHILSEGIAQMVPTSRWQDWLRQYALTFRSTMLRYRDSARMVNIAEPAERTRHEIVPAIAEPLTKAGFPQAEAILAEGIVASFALGWVSHEQNPALRQILSQLFDLESAYESGVDTIIDGLEKRFAAFVVSEDISLPASSLRQQSR